MTTRTATTCISTATTTTPSSSSSSSSSLSLARNNNAGDGGDSIQGIDRILSCLPYLLPMIEGDRYGRFIYARFPPLGMADAIVLGPLESIFYSIPFLGFAIFLGMTVLSRQAETIPRSIRFNLQQAVLIDIALIFPSLLGQVLGGSWVPRALAEPASNFVFYFVIFSVGYSILSNLVLGRQPNQIPWISEAADLQIGPF
jgi:Chloroplast import apparatus Tic20-like